MFDIDNWQEIFATIKKNKLRTFLTGFSVAWGIFMLIVLLGSGKGLENGIHSNFDSDAANSVWIYPGQTSIPYKGIQPGKFVRLTNEDYERLKLDTSKIERISSRFDIRGADLISYKNEYGSFGINTVHPDMEFIENSFPIKGRFINNIDIKEYDIHLNFPGGMPVDGPSAGISMAIAIYSAIKEYPKLFPALSFFLRIN